MINEMPPALQCFIFSSEASVWSNRNGPLKGYTTHIYNFNVICNFDSVTFLTIYVIKKDLQTHIHNSKQVIDMCN